MVIYKTTNLLNGKIYIGQDKNNNPNYLGSGTLIKNAIKKYGKSNFKKEILYECSTIDELNEKEKFFISEYKSTNKNIGYNIAIGGSDGCMLNRKHTNETKKKMSLSAMGKKKTDEHRKKLSIANKGRKMSIEEKRKRSESSVLKGKKKSPLSVEIKKKISESKKNKKLSKETKEKMTFSRLGEKNPFYGKKHDENFLLKKRKPIIQLDENDRPINEWKSIRDASEKLDIYESGICAVLKGRYKTCGGFKFKYKDE